MKIKKEETKTLIVVFLMISFLLTVIVLRFKNFDPSGVTVTFPSSKEINVPSFDDLFFQEDIDIITGNSDEKETFHETSYTHKSLKEVVEFEYPSHWEEVSVSGQEEANNLKMIFLAYSPASTFPKTITVFKVNENNIEKIVEQIEGGIKDEVEDFEITEKIESNDGYLMKSSYSTPEGLSFTSRKKVVFFNEDAYIFFLSSLSNQWQSFEEVVNHILSSIQIKQLL